jgi:hypothetical protein
MGIETNKKLAYLSETKDLIRAALIEKGQTVGNADTFRSYADKILSIPVVISGGGGETDGNLKIAYGQFVTDAENNRRQTITHGLGEMPDFVFVYYFHSGAQVELSENGVYMMSAWGMNSRFTPLGGGAGIRGCYAAYGCVNNESAATAHLMQGGGIMTGFGMDEISDSAGFAVNGWIATPDDSTFEVGANTWNKLMPGVNYYWIAMSGIGATGEYAEGVSF